MSNRDRDTVDVRWIGRQHLVVKTRWQGPHPEIAWLAFGRVGRDIAGMQALIGLASMPKTTRQHTLYPFFLYVHHASIRAWRLKSWWGMAAVVTGCRHRPLSGPAWSTRSGGPRLSVGLAVENGDHFTAFVYKFGRWRCIFAVVW